MQLKKLASQVAIYGIPSIVGRFLNFLLVPLYTYTLPTDEYGVVTEFYAYMALALVILTYGMETAFFRFMKKYQNAPKVYSTIVISLLASSSIFLTLMILFSDMIGSGLGYAHASLYVKWFAMILVMDVLCSIPFCLLRNQNKSVRFALLKIVNIVLNIGFNLFFILFCTRYLEQHPDSLLRIVYFPEMKVGYIFISNLIASGATLLMLLPEWKQLKWKFDLKLWKEMMVYALPVMVWGITGVINGTMDRILLRFLTPEADALSQLGIYGACYKLSIIINLFVQAYRFAVEPFFFQSSDAKDAPANYARLTKYFVVICSFMYLVCLLFLDYFQFLIGKDYREGIDIVPVLLMANVFLGIFFNLSVWYKIEDKTKIGMYIALLGSAVSIGLNFLLIPIFGFRGAAWVVLICYVVMCASSYFWGKKYYPIPYEKKKIFFYLALAWFGAWGFRFLDLSSRWGRFGLAMGILSVYAVVVLKMEPEIGCVIKKISKRICHKK